MNIDNILRFVPTAKTEVPLQKHSDLEKTDKKTQSVVSEFFRDPLRALTGSGTLFKVI